jgi:hypothetical protein
VDCSQIYDHGTIVTLTAIPAASSTFDGWSGACSGSSTCQVTMEQARFVSAVFTLKTYNLSVTVGGSGHGSVTSDVGGIECFRGEECSLAYDHGTLVTLTAAPESNSDFTGWTGDCTGTDTCQVTMDQVRSVTAAFTLKTHDLSVSPEGSGDGTVTSDIDGIDCGVDCSETYDHDTLVILTATPSVNSIFTGWTGGSCGGTGECQVSMVEASSITATFTIKSYNLSVSKSGTGTGTVTSNLAGIDCGEDCTQPYDHGTGVTLTATPASNSVFAGWSGACTGTEACVVTMDQARSVTAAFKGKSSISLRIRKTSARLKPSGGVAPAHPGKYVGITLFKKKAGRFVKVTSKKVRLSSTSKYATALRRPGRGSCRIKATFSHADHVSSSVTKTFRC